MWIRELYLKNFGKFSNQTFLIKDGINLIYGENEFGKSTLFAFIKGMLFGMERSRGRASKNDAFSQYEPWDNPNYYAGVLRFTSGGKNFRIERSFDKITKSASLICEDDGEELSIEQGDLEVLLDGMTRSSFENTIAIGQLGVETNQDLASELKNFAANYYESKDGEIDVTHARDLLKQKQHDVEQQIRQDTMKKERQRSRIEQECEYVRRDIEKLKIDEHYAQKSLKETNAQGNDDELQDAEKIEHLTEPVYNQTRRKTKIVLSVMLTFLFIIAVEVVLIVVTRKSEINHIVMIFSAIADISMLASITTVLWVQKTHGKRDSNQTPRTREKPESERFQWETNRIQSNIREKQIRLNNLNECLEELEDAGHEPTQNERKRQAICLATQTIDSISADIVKGFGYTLNEKTSEIIAAITEQKYEKLYVDDKMKMFLLTQNKRVPIERLSRGTIEQIYFALRMAVIDVLYEEDFPVILDDTFAFYDDVRLEAVLKWLSKQKRQVILFTCQRREREILKNLGIPFGMNE